MASMTFLSVDAFWSVASNMVVGLRAFELGELGVRRRGGRRACVAGRERAAQQRERRTARRARRGVPLQRVSTTGGRPAKSCCGAPRGRVFVPRGIIQVSVTGG